jgi:hypothetical protein
VIITSAFWADVFFTCSFVIPEVPQTDTNEHVKETAAHYVDVIIPEVPQTDTKFWADVSFTFSFVSSNRFTKGLMKVVELASGFSCTFSFFFAIFAGI